MLALAAVLEERLVRSAEPRISSVQAVAPECGAF